MSNTMGRPVSTFWYGARESGLRRMPLRRFSMHFADLERQLGVYAKTGAGMTDSTDRRTIVRSELRNLGDRVLVPVLQGRAPQRSWGGDSKAPHQKELWETIKATVTTADVPEVRIDMGWWGMLTITERGRLHAHGKVMRLILPGGQVIFRREVGPATMRAYSTGELRPPEPGGLSSTNQLLPEKGSHKKGAHREAGFQPFNYTRNFPPLDAARGRQRMKWAENAWLDIQKSQVIQVVATNILARLMANRKLAPFVVVPVGKTEDENSYLDNMAQAIANRKGGYGFEGQVRSLDSVRINRAQRRIRNRKTAAKTHVYSEKHRPHKAGINKDELAVLHNTQHDLSRGIQELDYRYHERLKGGDHELADIYRRDLRESKLELASLRNQLRLLGD